MQLHISPSLRHVTVLPSKGLREFIKVKVGSRRFSYRMVFYSLLFFTFLLRFVFVLTAVDNIDGQSKCSNIGCLGKRLGPRILGRRLEPTVPQVIYQVLEEPANEDEIQGDAEIPQTLEDFVTEMKDTRPDAKTFASRLKAMLPAPELVPSLVDNSFFHFVLASDNILASSVVASSLVRNSLHPNKVVLHIITDRKTHSPMQAWFSLHPLTPAIIEFRGGSSAIVANNTEKPKVIAAKLQALSPKYNSLMNHIRIHLPELFPSLNKVVFLDDDIVIQTDLSPLWDIDMDGKYKRTNLFFLNAELEIRPKFVAAGDFTSWFNSIPGHVHVIDPFWHMLGLGYQDNTSIADAKSAGVVHFNGRAKPWLDIAFPQLRPLWSKYVNYLISSSKGVISGHLSMEFERKLLPVMLMKNALSYEQPKAGESSSQIQEGR
ncbi:hypothetical protein C3L33_09913, partial [Rhododendron williamsianum]